MAQGRVFRGTLKRNRKIDPFWLPFWGALRQSNFDISVTCVHIRTHMKHTRAMDVQRRSKVVPKITKNGPQSDQQWSQKWSRKMFQVGGQNVPSWEAFLRVLIIYFLHLARPSELLKYLRQKGSARCNKLEGFTPLFSISQKSQRSFNASSYQISSVWYDWCQARPTHESCSETICP